MHYINNPEQIFQDFLTFYRAPKELHIAPGFKASMETVFSASDKKFLDQLEAAVGLLLPYHIFFSTFICYIVRFCV